MLGAIVGDMIGSVYEHRPIKTKEFPLWCDSSRFTDDTVLTVAVAAALLGDRDYAAALKEFGRSYPDAGYGTTFRSWLDSPSSEPYGSWGNGSAMRVSPVGFALDNVEEVLDEAERTAAVTHDHPEGIKGAQAVALAVFRARNGAARASMAHELTSLFGYDLSGTPDEIRRDYHFDVSCQGSVPQALVSFLASHSFEDAVRNAVSLGGDSDTLACVAGAVAEAYYGGVPAPLAGEARARLPGELLEVVERFETRFG